MGTDLARSHVLASSGCSRSGTAAEKLLDACRHAFGLPPAPSLITSGTASLLNRNTATNSAAMTNARKSAAMPQSKVGLRARVTVRGRGSADWEVARHLCDAEGAGRRPPCDQTHERIKAVQ